MFQLAESGWSSARFSFIKKMADCSSLLACNAVSLGEYFRIFRRIFHFHV